MYLKNIKLKNFRNINECNISPGKNINFIYGKNAQGKTNFIESIYYSSIFKSFRTNKNIDLINENEDKTYINLKIKNRYVDNDLKIIFDNKNSKKIKINGNKPDKKNFYRILNCISYYPDEIVYLKTYPSFRRNLIDRSIFFINNEYLDYYNKYSKCLKQRNIFIKNNNNNYDIWMDKLIEYGFLIINKRIDFIKRINSYLNLVSYENDIKEVYSINYDIYDEKNIKNDLKNRFIASKNKENKYGYTVVGPHTDDIKFNINCNNINKYSSEGQKRSFLLSYKQAQILDYYKHHNDYPILILDDMGSELDSFRKKNVFSEILNKSGQVFITMTQLPDGIYEDSKIYEVNNGKISEFLCN